MLILAGGLAGDGGRREEKSSFFVSSHHHFFSLFLLHLIQRVQLILWGFDNRFCMVNAEALNILMHILNVVRFLKNYRPLLHFLFLFFVSQAWGIAGK